MTSHSERENDSTRKLGILWSLNSETTRHQHMILLLILKGVPKICDFQRLKVPFEQEQEAVFFTVW